MKRYAILLPVGDKVVRCSQVEKKTSRRIIGLLLCSLQPTGHRQHTSLSDSAPGKSDLSPTREHHRHDLYKLLIVAQTRSHGMEQALHGARLALRLQAMQATPSWVGPNLHLTLARTACTMCIRARLHPCTFGLDTRTARHFALGGTVWALLQLLQWS